MNVLLQRHGIVIKTVNVTGDRASIGSGESCDIMIDDPYLAAHVADLVKRPDGWHIVDTATSMDGIARNGTRVDDELVAPDSVYSVGGFELVIQEGSGAPAAHRAPATAAGGVLPTIMEDVAVPRTMMEVPATMMESTPGQIPRTMYEAPIPPSARPSPAAVPQPVPYAPQPVAPVVTEVPRKGPRFRLVIITAVVLMFLLLLIVIVGRGGEKKPQVAAKPKPAPVTSTTSVAPPTAAPASATELLAQLRYDDALAAWQKQIDAGSADAALRERYAGLALEIARIHEANGSPAASSYYEKAAKYGAPGSAAVAEANRKLGR
jgi:hypothetical protein